jgi:hypothetical protein
MQRRRNRGGLSSSGSGGSGKFILPITNLVDNWDASDGDSISEATGVDAWQSQVVGGHPLLQAIGANQPVYDPVAQSITFDGIAHFLKTAAFTLNQPETVYIVTNPVAWGAFDYFFSGVSPGTMILFQSGTTPAITISAGLTTASNSELAIGSDGVACTVFNGASSSIKVNNTTTTTGNAGANNAGGLTLGANATGTSNYSNIIVYEVAIYSVAHDAATQAAIIAGLTAKWGI